MDQQPQSLRELFANAEVKRRDVESSYDSNSPAFQEKLSAAIATYEKCSEAVDRISLFSPNETLEDISSNDLQYMPIDFHIAELVQRVSGGDRKAYLLQARESYDKFLKLLDTYDILSKSDAKLLEQYKDAPNSFSTASTSDASARRDTKIARFRAEKEMKSKLEHLRQNPAALQNDDAALRQLHLTNISLCVHTTFQSLESIAQELQILSLAPPTPSAAGTPDQPADLRQRNTRGQDGYSERLDLPLSQLSAGGRGGPILSADGKPLRPFTLLDSRQRLQQGVFRPDHSLPTMTIDEYLEEEKRRGGMIEGGGEQSGIQPGPNEDDFEKADEETMKARRWDEFTEDNPKGAGNTMNRG
ncbi:type 2A phosphatase-associated protein 42 [Saccharata proteae CBS 121410]|uniref:Type 2A phosphatase-associated protein 42 n=1 Tax=Saccharata proteae CBS 121410 TaxID=1314787 RepID=A0A9P4LTN2_9PEZI|nr:type 2A phosphatase-associated protein 42 [Saccharata proteae CBS 121410]